MEPTLSEVRAAELVKAWNIRELLADGEHPRSAAFHLEYKNIGSSFIARPVDGIPELDITEEVAADPIQLDEEESSSGEDNEGDNRGGAEGGSSEASSSGEGSSSSKEVSEAPESSSASSSSSEEDMAPPGGI